MSNPLTHTINIAELYANLALKHNYARKTLGQPLTLTEKIIWSHLDSANQEKLQRGSSFVLLRPDRVAMQDATAQMAILQFIQAQKKNVAVPTTVHCDHLIVAYEGAGKDMANATVTNQEVFDFLSSAAKKYGMGFWKPGSGIIHQVVLENYAFPGGMMLGTDSHTPNAGGLGMMAVGVGGADAVDVMVGMPWEVLYPKITGVHLKGKLNGWTSGKDIILKLLEILTVKGGTNKVIEYFGPGVESLSCTAQATVTNMGAELGATCSLFPYHKAMGAYLRATRRADIADLAEKHVNELCADAEVLQNPTQYYDEVIEIDLDSLEPYVVGPHSPDKARPISALAAEAKREKYPELTAALIGSCTNSSYEDIGRAASVAKQALEKGIKTQAQFFVSPGSDQVFDTTQRDGYLDTLREFGAEVMANACGPCIGQWKRRDNSDGKSNSIITSFNRNFKGRNDGNVSTLAFIGSPEIVTAMSLAGSITFNPLTDKVKGSDGQLFSLAAPIADALPSKGFQFNDHGLIPPATDGSSVELRVDEKSDRLQLLAPFAKWDGKDIINLPILVKAQGKCTTDHISPAGKWLKYRGHLDNISNNMFLGAVNAFSGNAGKGKNAITGEEEIPFADIARDYKSRGLGWVAIGDENYGEGSSREHAAMSPRFLGCRAVITRSIARIHETNLKKQGLLPLRFSNPDDYDKILEADRISIIGLNSFSPGKNLTMVVKHAEGGENRFEVMHTFNAEQIEWFKAGSALNRF